MKTIVRQKMTYEEFLNFDDGTDYLYELEDGKLIQMAIESQINCRIATFLLVYFVRMGIPYYRLTMKTEVAVPSKTVNVRIPDLVVFSEKLAEVIKEAKRSLVTLDMPAPSLVVEIVSPSQAKRDYEDKRSEYCARGIPEYWIVDPISQKVTVLQLKDDSYQEQICKEDQPIVSLLLGKLELTAKELLKGGEE